MQSQGVFVQGFFAHDGGPQLGELAFRHGAEMLIDVFRADEAQHGVAQKFQPFIAVHPFFPVLVGVGTVGQGVLQQALIVELISNGWLGY